MPKKMTMMKNVLSRRKPLHGDASDKSKVVTSSSTLASGGGNEGTTPATATATVDPSLVTVTKMRDGGCDNNGNHHRASTPSQPASAEELSYQVTQTQSSPPVSPLTPPRGSKLYALGHSPLPVPQMGGAVQVKEVVTVEESSRLALDAAYERVPQLEIIELPRGGVSIETQAVGYVQYGIPPETIKDSMRLGIAVPSVYIVPVDRFCREMGPALGVNLAEFEFPAYFNFFVQRKRCTLVVDSVDAERNIQRVFSETLLGPLPFRRKANPLKYAEEDFAPDFPQEAIPDFHKELQHFRIMPNGEELVLETLLSFCHFEAAPAGSFRDNLGIPPLLESLGSGVNGAGDGDVEGSSKVENNDVENDIFSACSVENNIDDDDDDDFEEDAGLGGESEEDIRRRVTKASVISGNDPVGGGLKEGRTKHGIKKKVHKSLSYSQIQWIGDVARIYPSDATEDQIALNQTKRVEIFKMPSGTDYVLHDIDESNTIVGRARFSGNVRVTEGISVIGLDDDKKGAVAGGLDEAEASSGSSVLTLTMPPTFYPPSFGVTVLGNSHGFDKSGSTSGYVLWINGRGIMIDPPPYSSATLEREGIRPRTIVGIILTHCHADHDAGAFQKVLTGSPVIVITTPTIYKSFIRKYAALSSLSPALLRQSHRYKPAIIGEPLRFQGATFHFTYTLHSIPCVGFRVDWRGRSMVFTGDHFNDPPALQKLVDKGVLSKARCADLNHLPLQKTDLLLHEAGAPPIHTPLDVLLKLPAEVKKRLYVVHTSALPEGCELRVAPTGTEGTIRLDQIRRSSSNVNLSRFRTSILDPSMNKKPFPQLLEEVDEYADSELFNPMTNTYAHLSGDGIVRSQKQISSEPPPVSLRPSSSSDAWFILNLLSAVPFLSSLSYTSTMDVLEIARVAAFSCNDIVLPTTQRSKFLVVVWEGTCMEREGVDNCRQRHSLRSSITSCISSDDVKGRAVWYAGDWTGPRILQPEKRLSGDSSSSRSHDVVAMSAEGVKVIMVDFSNLHKILRDGSALYRKYHLSLSQQYSCSIPLSIAGTAAEVFKKAVENLKVIELLDCNTGLRKLTAVQKRYLECLVEGPVVYSPGQRLWRSGSYVDQAFIVVAGTVSFVPRRRHGGTAGNMLAKSQNRVKQTHEARKDSSTDVNLGETMRIDAVKAIRELQSVMRATSDDISEKGSDLADAHEPDSKSNSVANSLTETDDYQRLSQGLLKWAERHETQDFVPERRHSLSSNSTNISPDVSIHDFCHVPSVQEEQVAENGFNSIMMDGLQRPSKDHFANKVLGRLYNRRAVASGLVFSRGHFLGDIEKMVQGLLASVSETDSGPCDAEDSEQFTGDEIDDALSWETMTIHEEGGENTAHTSTLAAGKDGCVVLILPKASLIPFLDAHPGVLLSLLGTQVVV